MTMRLGIVLAGLVISLSPAWADVISTFDADADGWVGISADLPSYTLGPEFAVSHNAGGYIAFADPNSSEAFFRAPSAYRGNLLHYRGGSLSWRAFSDPEPTYNGPLLVLKGAGQTLIYRSPVQPFGTSFATTTVTLAPNSGWSIAGGGAVSLSQFQAVLASVDEMWLTAELYYGVTETVALDDVTLHSVLPPVGVPEPAELSILTLAAGGGAMLGWHRRNKRS